MAFKHTLHTKKAVHIVNCLISLTGLEGLEPSNAGVRILCLAIWRQPIIPLTNAIITGPKKIATPFFKIFLIFANICNDSNIWG